MPIKNLVIKVLISIGGLYRIGDVLAIHAVSHASVTGDTIPKVLDIKGTLESRCEEASEGCNERSKRCHH
jgi:hypothetical protein